MDYQTGCKSYRATLRALLIKHFTDLVLDQNGKLFDEARQFYRASFKLISVVDHPAGRACSGRPAGRACSDHLAAVGRPAGCLVGLDYSFTCFLLLVEDYQRYSPRFGYFVTLEMTAVSCGDTIFTRTPPVDATEPTAGKNYGSSGFGGLLIV